MASFNGSIDLLSLNGAQVFTGIDQNSPQRAYVCVPIDLNEIKMTTARKDPNRQIAGLRVNIWPLNENYKNAARRSAQERGDSNISVPTHEMQMSFSTDYVKLIVAKFPKLVEQVKEANKERTPDIVNENPTDENSHLFKAIRLRMNKRIAMLYQPQIQTGQQTAYPQHSYAAAGSATAYVPPAESNGPDISGYAPANEDDLPF